MSTANPLTFISSILPKLSLPNNDNAPTNDDNKTGLISVSKIKSSKYSPDVFAIIIPFIYLLILITSILPTCVIYFLVLIIKK